MKSEKLDALDRTPFIAPSGKRFHRRDAVLWLDLERNGSFGWGPDVRFNSGFISPVYVRMRNELSTNIALFTDVGRNLRRFIQDRLAAERRRPCLIGIPTAGAPLAQVVATQSLAHGPQMCFKAMRTALKTHGKDTMYIGPADTRKHAYCTVENVLSTGKAMLEAFDHMEPEGYPVRDMRHFVFASWNLGGVRKLADAGIYSVHVEYEIPDVIALFVHLGHWESAREKDITQRLKEWHSR